jgi:hypothetical protein
MIEEISKIGEINSVSDFLDFKLSVQTIIILVVAWSIFVSIVVVFMLGGINNTIDYLTNIFESTKQKVTGNNKKFLSKDKDSDE